jgi:hypothetical protein
MKFQASFAGDPLLRPFAPLGAQSELPGPAVVVSSLCFSCFLLFYVVSTILNVLFDDEAMVVWYCHVIVPLSWYAV